MGTELVSRFLHSFFKLTQIEITEGYIDGYII